jgi:hypothetical protein
MLPLQVLQLTGRVGMSACGDNLIAALQVLADEFKAQPPV